MNRRPGGMPGWLRWLIALGIALLALRLPTQLLPSSDAPQTLAVVTALASIGAALAIVRVFGRRWWHTPSPADASDTLSAAVAALSPYATKDLERFGKYTLNLAQVPDPVDYHTPVVSQVSLEDPDRPGKQTSSEQREVAV